jgi:ribosomal protein S17E
MRITIIKAVIIKQTARALPENYVEILTDENLIDLI